jgi:AraC family transcriptional regulator
MSQATSFRDWYRDGPLAGRPQVHRSVVPEALRVIEAGPVHLINVTPPAGPGVDPSVPEYALHLVLSTPPLLRIGFNRPLRWLAMSPGVMLVTPPDTACDFIADGPSHVLTIAIPKARVEDFAETSRTRVEVRREEVFRQPHLEQQIVRLWHKLVDDEAGSGLFADQVMRAVMQTLAWRTEPHAPTRHAPSAAAHASERLATPTIHRLRDFVESRLADDLDVMMMANVAALSPAHFARAFAATVGVTPFHYVMTRRLARAHELLRRTDRSVLSIALDVGFKTPSHFTSRFRREFGITPRAIRPDSRRPDEYVAEPRSSFQLQKARGVVVEDVALR